MGTAAVLIVLITIVTGIIQSMRKKKKLGKSMICGGECKHCGGHCSH